MSNQRQIRAATLRSNASLTTHHPFPSFGFTLLEVLIALAVLAIALVVLLGLRNRDVELANLSRNVTEATALAKMKMVETNVEGFPSLGEIEGDFGKAYPGLRWFRVVSPTPFDYVREVRILVMWGQDDEDTVELAHYVFEEQ